jgi:PAS domain S-box-containing protein/putative nucleotidyltransferase with HDIG domain
VSILGETRDITERRQAERKIRESEILYRSLIETSPDAMGLMDINGTILMHNKQALEVFGFELTEDLRGKNIIDMVAPENYQESLKNAEKLKTAKIIRNWEVTSHKKDGRPFWVEINTSMIFDEAGKRKSIMAVFKDITERKLAEEELEKSYASLKKTLNDAIDTMAKIVETRDPYTAGHQHRVADLANAIAREMKLGDTRIDQLRMAAVIHDIGKINVPSDILSKPGKLSDIEFSLIKTHPQNGYDIVKGMDFPCSIAKAVLQHHERLDGSGYPNGLKGEDMLLEAKILAVADVVEAMASHRPYRAALGIDEALEEISNKRGRLYDPDVVDACVKLFNSGKFEFKPV